MRSPPRRTHRPSKLSTLLRPWGIVSLLSKWVLTRPRLTSRTERSTHSTPSPKHTMVEVQQKLARHRQGNSKGRSIERAARWCSVRIIVVKRSSLRLPSTLTVLLHQTSTIWMWSKRVISRSCGARVWPKPNAKFSTWISRNAAIRLTGNALTSSFKKGRVRQNEQKFRNYKGFQKHFKIQESL